MARRIVLLVLGLMICTSVYAVDVLLKDIPDGITEQQVKEWNSILIERYHNQKIQQIPELVAASDKAKVDIDTYRKANLLTPKFEVAKPVVEVEPIVEG